MKGDDGWRRLSSLPVNIHIIGQASELEFRKGNDLTIGSLISLMRLWVKRLMTQTEGTWQVLFYFVQSVFTSSDGFLTTSLVQCANVEVVYYTFIITWEIESWSFLQNKTLCVLCIYQKETATGTQEQKSKKREKDSKKVLKKKGERKVNGASNVIQCPSTFFLSLVTFMFSQSKGYFIYRSLSLESRVFLWKSNELKAEIVSLRSHFQPLAVLHLILEWLAKVYRTHTGKESVFWMCVWKYWVHKSHWMIV